MPTREYICEDCGYEWEQLEHMGARPERFCLRCKKETAKRKISRSNFHLKGSGWSRDGYKK